MCGICGFINLDGAPASPAIVKAMNETIVHRGPDDDGVFLHEATALGHRRLSIVDVNHGHQPMATSSGQHHIVYNGEIYNHQEIRKRFGDADFNTRCDTETILASFEHFGVDCLTHLQGMFAFAILDRKDGALFVARDRLGIKPLYYFQSEKLFAFASEIKALLAHPDIEAQVNVEQIPIHLALKYSLNDETLFRGIRKLQPGYWLRVANGKIKKAQYWNLSFEPKSNQYDSIGDAADDFRDKFRESVRSRLMADVPLGVFLSGGIDSSVIAATMNDLVAGPIKSFSVAFQEREYSELSYANEVAKHIGSEHHEVVVSPEQWFMAWPMMVYHEDEPIAHPSSIPLHFVSKLAAQHVKVVLSGEGADELLAGYERYYQTLYNLRFGKYLPNSIRFAAQKLLNRLPDKWTIKRKAVRTSLFLSNDIESVYLDNYASMSRDDLGNALTSQVSTQHLEKIYEDFVKLMQEVDAKSMLDKILYADIKTYLLELLMKQDQMSMSASLESRVPFLDHRLVEFACRLPTRFKQKGFATKRILRKAMGSTVPPSIVTRAKRGFPTPTKEWFRGAYYPVLKRLLLSNDSLIHQYVRREFIENSLTRHHQNKWNLQEQIWSLANLEIWLRIFIDGQSPSTIFEIGFSD